MSTIANLIDGGKISESADGYTHTVAYFLCAVPGDGQRQLWNALQDASIPRIGDPHPVVPGIVVTDRSGEPIDDGQIRVEVNYAPGNGTNTPAFDLNASGSRPEGTIAISSTATSEQTNFDKYGAPLKTTYTGKLVDDDGNETDVKNQEQVATIEVQRPQLLITFTRRERGSPLELAATVVGCINREDLGSIYAPQTLLCTRIDATSDDNGATFNVTYEFQHKPDTWAQVVVFIDNQIDRPPPDVVKAALGGPFGARSANGLAVYDIYPEANFEALRLPW